MSKVSGQWIVPAVHTSSSRSTYSSIWVGIDGFSNETVQQIGTAQDVYKGKKYYFAWVELYPAWPFEIDSFPVHPGDKIAASVKKFEGSNVFEFTIINKSRSKTATFSSYQPDAKNQSAEWIVEAPSSSTGVLPLAKFDKVTMTNCYATISGSKGSINGRHRGFASITMKTEDGVTKATPSPLSSEGTKFSVTWKHE